jgi:hypothetical protein
MTTCKYRGVVEFEDRYAAVIDKNGQPTVLGIYDTPEAAAMVRDNVAFAMFGEFAVLNFPELFDTSASGLVSDSAGW